MDLLTNQYEIDSQLNRMSTEAADAARMFGAFLKTKPTSQDQLWQGLGISCVKALTDNSYSRPDKSDLERFFRESGQEVFIVGLSIALHDSPSVAPALGALFSGPGEKKKGFGGAAQVAAGVAGIAIGAIFGF